jgi:hypothetical protein
MTPIEHIETMDGHDEMAWCYRGGDRTDNGTVVTRRAGTRPSDAYQPGGDNG